MLEHLETEITVAPERIVPGLKHERLPDGLEERARGHAKQLALVTDLHADSSVPGRCHKLRGDLVPWLAELRQPGPKETVSDDYRWLYDNARLVYGELDNVSESMKLFRDLPQVRSNAGHMEPRIVAVADGLLSTCEWHYTDECFSTYLAAFQQVTVLQLQELWVVVPALKLVLLEKIAAELPAIIKDKTTAKRGMDIYVPGLRDVAQAPWTELLGPLIEFDRVLEQDPAGAYGRMDFEGRNLYRTRVMEIAARSDVDEMAVAAEAVALAREAQQRGDHDPRVATRRSHVGYYLMAEGAPLLHKKVGFRPGAYEQIQEFLRKHPDEFYLASIEVLAFVILSAILFPRLDTYTSLGLVLFSMLLLVLPCSQSAVQVMNYLATSVLPAKRLPKLDFSKGVPDDCFTLIAIPALLLNEKQVKRLTDDLEVRYLGNNDRNFRFVLLTDLPDSRERPVESDHPLVGLCSQLIDVLNAKYAPAGPGPFLLLHRHRVFNPQEGVWMGWERKRGKLMDLNKLLHGEYDSFPVKTGDLTVLSRVRFVITLDADTELPRGSAHRMVGALAHPLNQAIIDPEKNIVVAGYGILQPRVGVSVQSASQSRLANIYSGQTGFDIYTRAVSDVYQDLYGEGSFAGKGIYEVATIHRVLDRRFPRNALLSHDLIEGAYARAGLVSDIEIIEDYPSHYSAYNRRKHRWLRGDWQVAEWLFPNVRNEVGEQVANPISLVSQWKILDNLRRSLVEPATLLLLLFGWLVLPGPARYWTLATIIILFVPAWCQFLFNLVRAAVLGKSVIARDAVSELFSGNINVFLTLTFLAHQTLLSTDAVVRSLVRKFTRRRLLEWETAAEAELGAQRRTPVDIYLDWIPALALGLGVLVYFGNRQGLSAALPILLLWALSKAISLWLNRPPRPARTEVSHSNSQFLRQAAVHTWRYFAEFSNEEHHWLIPDNVQEGPYVVAARVSPTNIGLLLNARQVACKFGYLTVPEFVDQTRRTLATISRLPMHRGHLYNWYDTQKLEPLTPLFISSVDNGNFLVSLWTLRQGCLDLLHKPLLDPGLAAGVLDHARDLSSIGGVSRRQLSTLKVRLEGTNWLHGLLGLSETVLDQQRRPARSKNAAEIEAKSDQLKLRVEMARQLVASYLPWLLPEFGALLGSVLDFTRSETPALADLAAYTAKLQVRLDAAKRPATPEQRELCERLASLLPAAQLRAEKLVTELRAIVGDAGKLADEMDFSFLIDPRRKLLSIGFDVSAQRLQDSCYDLLASEARTAVFAAIAKDDIPQETWFLLGRAHILDRGRPALLSWTGTMFEYLMPALWMRVYPGTLLERTRAAAVRMQQEYGQAKQVPWGTSESAFAKRDDAGNYQYRAFGLRRLALSNDHDDLLVISPYSTFLALPVDPRRAIQNLRRMTREGWSGKYGFYEAADFSPGRRRSWFRRYELVRCWMAHHQGMSLLAMANFLHDDVVQCWFHSDPRVQATELLLHEKPVTHVRPLRVGYGTAAA